MFILEEYVFVAIAFYVLAAELLYFCRLCTAELERQKQLKKREFQKKLTETLFLENVSLIAERERKRQEKFLADR
jgi:hypothetical protein